MLLKFSCVSELLLSLLVIIFSGNLIKKQNKNAESWTKFSRIVICYQILDISISNVMDSYMNYEY